MTIKTLIVDDSVVFRKALSEAISSFPNVEVFSTAPSGSIALQKMAQNKTDLVLLDVHMDEMDGVATLERIRRDFPNAIVVMVSGISSRSADITIRALEMGAIDFIKKPDSKDYAANVLSLKNDLKSVLRFVETRFLTRRPEATSSIHATPSSAVVAHPKTVVAPYAPTISDKKIKSTSGIPDSLSILAIGVSTGGPEALARLIPLLPADFPLPVVLVQHMPPNFTKSLAESLSKKSKLRVVEGAEGQAVVPGQVIIAPGGQHMVIRNSLGTLSVALNMEAAENSCRPSVDVLFRSVADALGDKGVLSVILTGMGSDGQKGVEYLKRRKCYSLTQAESSCVVYGMPKAVDDTGLSDESHPIERMAARITEIAKATRQLRI